MAGERITFDSPIALINDAIVAAIASVVAASVWFAYRPRRWLAVLLLVISLVPACLFAYALWTHISFFHYFGSHYFNALRTVHGEWLWLFAAILFVTLALLWAAICLRLREVITTT
jgi:hypothetical protein